LRRIERLEKLLRRRSRQTAPFSHDKPKGTGGRPGRAKGHAGAFAPEPDHVDEDAFVPLENCPDCGTHIDRVEDLLQFVVDLPEVRAFVLRIITQRGWCPCCRKTVRSRHPRQTSRAGGLAKVSLGPRALGLAADLKHRMGMPYRKIVDLFRTYFGIRLTHGAIIQGCLRLSERAKPAYGALVHVVKHSPVVHTDDTGWRIRFESAWLWVFATPFFTIYSP
jgi:transposase